MLIYYLSLSEKQGFKQRTREECEYVGPKSLTVCPNNTVLFLQTAITTNVLSLEAMRKLFQSAWQAASILLKWIEMKWILIGHTLTK